MKKSTIQTKRLTKQELKKINAGNICPVVFSCFDRYSGEEQTGVPGIQDGPCC
ncbi:hypothetical protein ABXT08_01095 [Chryseobacterium sp. NRRL B-14859]|uniref:hypothetical protein n=1 Tax=unclassified Chryseobacterium TaxID=2593645 RepID=UPI00161C825B|nr:hypothetical protein [Chryseobacterium sp. G0240]